MPNMMSLAATITIYILCKLHLSILLYAPKQIWILQCTYISHPITIYVPATNMFIKYHIWKSVHMRIWGKDTNICVTYKATCSPHKYTLQTIIHILPNKYGYHIAQVYPTALLPSSTYRPYIAAHMCPKIYMSTFNLSCYYCICTRYKYAHQVLNICCIVKLVDMHIWRRYTNICICHIRTCCY